MTSCRLRYAALSKEKHVTLVNLLVGTASCRAGLRGEVGEDRYGEKQAEQEVGY